MYITNNLNYSYRPAFGYKLHTNMLFEFISGIKCSKNDKTRLHALSAMIDTPKYIVKDCLNETNFDSFEKRLGDEILKDYPYLTKIKDEITKTFTDKIFDDNKVIKIFNNIKKYNFSSAFIDVKLNKDVITKIKSDYNIRCQKNRFIKQ